MKKIVIISLLICFIIGLSIGIYDILHPIMPDEYGAEYSDPNNWNSPIFAKDFLLYALLWIGIWIGLSIIVLFVPCVLIGRLFKKKKS